MFNSLAPALLLTLSLISAAVTPSQIPQPRSPGSQIVTTELSPDKLYTAWPEQRLVDTPAPCLRPDDLYQWIRRLEKRSSSGDQREAQLSTEKIGESFEGRAIHLISIGRGETNVLLWSQMHGDEPSATPALLDLADFLVQHSSLDEVRLILDRLTLHMIPMLNPDGALVYRRRNAQGIDINRDALSLSTPEGRLLKETRDRLEPQIGFNLHDQGRRTVVGDTGLLSTLSVLAVAGDKEGTVTEGRRRTMRAASAIVANTHDILSGRIARYDEDWSPRAFGDNLTAWGTPVILIESGGLSPGESLEELTRLNFVALLTTLYELARNDFEDYSEEIYKDLPRTSQNGFSDVALRGARLLQPTGPSAPYRADITFNRYQNDREAAGCGHNPIRVLISEIGDARFEAGGENKSLDSRLVTRPFAVSVSLRHLSELARETGLSRTDLLGRLLSYGIHRVDLAGTRDAKGPEMNQPSNELPRVHRLESAQSSPTVKLSKHRLRTLLEKESPTSMVELVHDLTGNRDTSAGLLELTVTASDFAPGTSGDLLVWRLEGPAAANGELSRGDALGAAHLETIWLRGLAQQLDSP